MQCGTKQCDSIFDDKNVHEIVGECCSSIAQHHEQSVGQQPAAVEDITDGSIAIATNAFTFQYYLDEK